LHAAADADRVLGGGLGGDRMLRGGLGDRVLPGGLASLLSPPLCWACRAPVSKGQPLCAACRRTLRWLEPSSIRIAGMEVWAPLAYEGPARELVRALKYRAAERLAAGMAAQIAATAPEGFLAGSFVPVPLHPSRLRRRGFNQAELLARELARRTGLAVAPCLARRRRRAPQTGRRRVERVGDHHGIQLAGPVPQRVTLVDDVLTTGATVAACARALRIAGCPEIRAVAYARTLAR
jgi:competence protein ComFC